MSDNSDKLLNEENLRREVSIWLKHAMEARGLNAAQVCRLVGMSPISLHSYLDGDRTPSMLTFARLCKILRLQPQSVFESLSLHRELLSQRELLVLASVESLRLSRQSAPCIKRVADDTGMSSDTVARLVRGLEADDWLKTHRPNRFWGPVHLELGPAWFKDREIFD